MKAIDLLNDLDACQPAKDWVADRTVAEAWAECPRGDWMLWIYTSLYSANKRELTLAKGHCAGTVLHLMTDDRSKAAVQAAIDYGNGLIDDEELKKAADAADASTASYAANAAYAAADAAADAAYAAAGAAYAAVDDAADAAYAAAGAARLTERKWQANKIREMVPCPFTN